MRKVIHVDMDAFYASVEQRDRPELKGKPVLVGGNPSGRGVVASASYEARRFGIRSAMSARNALRLCPHAVFVRPNFNAYKEASRQIRAIFFDYTELVEPLSLDEAYLDVTTNKIDEPSATKIAELIRARIKAELKLTASAGVAPNKFLAKLASDMRKPDGIFVISPAKVTTVLANLPVEKLWGVGPATAGKLAELGILTTADLRRHSKPDLLRLVGSFGSFLHDLAYGEDDREVQPHREAKSRGAETTFESDTTDKKILRSTLEELAKDVALALARLQRKGSTVTVKVRYSDFTTISRRRTVPTPLDKVEEMVPVAWQLLEQSTALGIRPVRLLGISISNFAEDNLPEQLCLSLLI